MGNLRDERVKKGVVDPKRARQAAHEQKARQKKLGPKAVAAERDQRQQDHQTARRQQREADRARAREQRQAELQREALAQAGQLTREHALSAGVRGPRRFHFVTREGKIPFLDVAEQIAERLRRGALAICQIPGTSPERFAIVPADVARKIAEINADLVLFHNINERA
ncbi:MAG: DUF2058 family protein [Acidobacteriota bacterium]|nr:MAG: DUF2058 family protein [Acidobacteriota bacterium]